MEWHKLTARSKPKAPCVLAFVWYGTVEQITVLAELEQLNSYLRSFRRDYNRFLELPEVK